MNTLFIVGNGLDISVGLKTSYQDFFDYYFSVPSEDATIQAMKQDIHSRRYETWADLEIGLGDYARNCDNKDHFQTCLINIKRELNEYLKIEREKLIHYELLSLKPLLSLESLLDPEPQSRFQQFASKLSSPNGIDFITFNYTPTLEHLLDYNGNNRPLSQISYLSSIVHIHGTLDEMMVMGVNDESQIANELLRNDMDIKEDFIKPEYNDACENNKNVICERLINRADIIVIYGSSVGLSDEKWWKLIGRRMNEKSYPLLVYLPYDAYKNQSLAPNRIRRWTQEYVAVLKQRFGITIPDDVLYHRVCVAVNRTLVPVKKNPQKPSKTD